MITIFAEKPEMGTKFAAALDAIHLSNGTNVSFDNIDKYEKQIIAQRTKDGFFRIRFNGQDAIVTWGIGHLCELKQAHDYDSEYKNWRKMPLPFIPPVYELKVSSGKEKQFNLVKKIFNSSDLIICATDDDREGDLIFDYIYRCMNCKKPYKRILFNKQSKEEFQKAFRPENLIDSKDRYNVISAGRARSSGDFAVGANITAAMTTKYNSRTVLSAGRVQTAVLNMITDRELEIRNFKPQDYWVVKGLFTTKDGSQYTGTHESKKFDKELDANRVMDKLNRNAAIATVKSVETKEYKKDKPHLYSLQTLQMEANKAYGFSLDETLKIAQSLYDSGFTTYPRTDSIHLTNDMGTEMQQVMDMLFTDKYYSRFAVNTKVNPSDKFYFDSSKVDGHYAIVPTKKPPQGLSNDESKIYYLIATSVICMVYPKATLSKTTIVTEAAGECFKTTGNSIVEPGFYKVIRPPKENMIPNIREGEKVGATFQKEAKKTEPPKRYTDATLLNAMMNCGKTLEDEELKKVMAAGPDNRQRGLGRPSSQASIVTTLIDRKYIEKRQKTFYPTALGMAFIHHLPVNELKSAVMTAQWEKRLDDIAKGTDTYESFMNDLESSVRNWTKQIIELEKASAMKELTGGNAQEGNKTDLKCPACGRSLIKYHWGYNCSGKSENICHFSVGFQIAGKVIPDKQMERLLKTGETEYMIGFKTKAGKSFGAKIIFDKENKQLAFSQSVSGTLKCPLCGKALRETEWGFSCTGYNETECKFSVGTFAKKKLAKKQVEALLAGKLVHVSGLKGKYGNFSADIYMEMDGYEKGKIKIQH